MSPFVPQLLAQARSWFTSSCLLSANLYPQRIPGDTGRPSPMFLQQRLAHTSAFVQITARPLPPGRPRGMPGVQPWSQSGGCLWDLCPGPDWLGCASLPMPPPRALLTPHAPPSQHWPPSLETTSLEHDLEGRHCFLDRKVLPKRPLSEWAGGEPALHEMGPLHPGVQEARTSGGQGAAAAPRGIGSPWEAPPAPPHCLGRSPMTL